MPPRLPHLAVQRAFRSQAKPKTEAMTDAPPQFFQKLSRIWSSRKDREIYVWVEYCQWEERGCRIYCLSRLKEMS